MKLLQVYACLVGLLFWVTDSMNLEERAICLRSSYIHLEDPALESFRVFVYWILCKCGAIRALQHSADTWKTIQHSQEVERWHEISTESQVILVELPSFLRVARVWAGWMIEI